MQIAGISPSPKIEPQGSASQVDLLNEFERFIHRDPARRGLISSEISLAPVTSPESPTAPSPASHLCAGQLAAAAAELAQAAVRVGIVTGFYIPRAEPAAAETDGPPGSLFLAACLQSVGVDALVITDAPCAAVVRAAAEAIDFPLEQLAVAPLDPRECSSWCDRILQAESQRGLSHLISVERVGPSHTAESISRQQPDATKAYLSEVAPEHHNHCHNMRGICIDAHTAPLHLLFERLRDVIPLGRTIGIGDGGNEIGMGSIPWLELFHRLHGEQAGRVPCRVPCDFTIVAGTSNWGAMALAAAVCVLRNRRDVLQPWTQHRHHAALQHLVVHGPAVDGVTGRREATVDGLPFLTYIQPWEGIRRTLGWT